MQTKRPRGRRLGAFCMEELQFVSVSGSFAAVSPSPCSALAIIAAVLMSPLVQAALSVLLTAGAAPGRRHLVLQFSFNDYLVAALGGLLLAIALVMAEAVRIAKENREII